MYLADRYNGCRISECLWEGHRLVALENRSLRVTVVASKGADLLELRFKPMDLDLFWHAPQSLLPPGSLVPPTARAGGAFLDYFPGGWQEVLPNGGGPCVYRGAELGQHGEVALLPWRVEVVDNNADSVAVRFSVETRRTPWRLERTLRLSGEAARLQIAERVTNLGEEPLHFMWGHHPTFGPPFLEPGCRIDLPPAVAVLPAEPPLPNVRYACGQRADWPLFQAPDGTRLRADVLPEKESRTTDSFHLEPQAGWCAIRNPRLGLGVALTWDKAVFPYLWCWQVYGGQWGYPYYGRTYNVALEPFTSPIGSLAQCAADGTAPLLASGASMETQLLVDVFTGNLRLAGAGPDGLHLVPDAPVEGS